MVLVLSKEVSQQDCLEMQVVMNQNIQAEDPTAMAWGIHNQVSVEVC